jgi:hypothetical protein
MNMTDAAVPTREPEVQAQIGRLQHSVDSMMELVQRMDSRLSPVLHRQPKDVPEKLSDGSMLCEIALQINDATEKVNDCRRFISEWLDELEV